LEKAGISKSKSSIINLLFNYANVSFVIINGLILVPLYLKYFSVGTYGSYLSSGNIVGMLGLLEGGTSFVFMQKLSGCYVKKDFKRFSEVLRSGFLISLSIFTLLVVIGLILFPFIADWVKAEPQEYKNIQYAFLLSAIGAGLNIVYHNIMSAFQALMKVSICGFSNIISIFVGISVTLLGLRFGIGVVAIPLGVLIRGMVGTLILFFSLILLLKKEKFPRVKINNSITTDLFRSILPIFGGGIAKSLVTNSQLLIITNFISPSASAIFFITGRIYQVCDSFLAPVASSIFSSISQIVAEGDKFKIKTNFVKIFYVFNFFSIFILSSSFILNSSFVTLLLGKEKYGGVLLSFFLCINMLFYTRFNFLSVNLYALGVFGKTVMYDVVGGILRLILIFSLIRYMGYIALPVAEFLSSVFLLGYFLNKLMINKIELKGKEMFSFVFSGAFLFFVIFSISIVWVFFLPNIKNWFMFIMTFICIAIINGGIIFVLSKESREFVIMLLDKTNLTKFNYFKNKG